MHERMAVLLEALRGMPAHLERLAAELEGRSLDTPAAGGFCFLEHVWHLADLERDGYGARIERLLAESAPALPDFDGEAVARARNYRSLALPDGLRSFRAAREQNLARLRALTPEQWLRAGTQAGVGPVTLGDVARMMAEHDAAHRAEVEALRAGRAAPALETPGAMA
jgi:hypothetical protein